MESHNREPKNTARESYEDEDDPLAYYLKQINKIPLLGAEAEKRCYIEIRYFVLHKQGGIPLTAVNLQNTNLQTSI